MAIFPPDRREAIIRAAIVAAMRAIEESSRFRFPLNQPAQSLAAGHIRDGVIRALDHLDYES